MRFRKYHALGNDYIVIHPEDVGRELTEQEVRRICHRNYGVGSDGILLGPLDIGGHPIGVRIFNPDGSEAEKSGNGLRIFSRYLMDQGIVDNRPFEIATKGGVVRSQIHGTGASVTIAMGKVSFLSTDIPVAGKPRDVLEEKIVVRGKAFTYCAATIGNPHCAVLYPNPSRQIACRYGPAIETDPRFPNRTNVQFMEVLDRNNIRIEIWERGAGYTLASGSSSCASAATARRLGLCDERIAVHMPGGVVDILVHDDYTVDMTGPVTNVCEGTIHSEVLLQPDPR